MQVIFPFSVSFIVGQNKAKIQKLETKKKNFVNLKIIIVIFWLRICNENQQINPHPHSNHLAVICSKQLIQNKVFGILLLARSSTSKINLFYSRYCKLHHLNYNIQCRLGHCSLTVFNYVTCKVEIKIWSPVS